MADLGPEWLTIILFGSLILLLLTGLPLVFAIGGVATFFIIVLWGPHALPILANRTYMAMDLFLLVAVPMFIFMGAMLQRCGIAEDMYELMYHWMSGLRGGLAAGTVIICTMFAAMVGISGAATTSMGLIALPAMVRRKYHPTIAGRAAGGTTVPGPALPAARGAHPPCWPDFRGHGLHVLRPCHPE